MAKVFVKKKVTPEDIVTFLTGRDPQERIVNFSYDYRNDYISIHYRDEQDRKCISRESFYPFLWATNEACSKMCNKDRNKLIKLMSDKHVNIKRLDTTNINGESVKEMEKGYTYLFYATKPMSYTSFLEFFRLAGNPVYSNKRGGDTLQRDDKQYLTVTPTEQYMIATGKRMFKGYEDYDELLRMTFDLETTGLDLQKDNIEQIGIRFNRPVRYNGKDYTFEKIYATTGENEEERKESILKNIDTFLKAIYTFKPDIITAHNGEAFDWPMLFHACESCGISLEELSSTYFKGEGIRKDSRDTILKLGGEIESFKKTIIPETIVTDSLHAVRRAQALDSSMLKSNLKYVTEYSKLNKQDRVYLPGDKISETYNDNEMRYCLNIKDGDWYIYDPNYNSETGEEKKGKRGSNFTVYKRNYIKDGYILTTGKDIAERYLKDDLYECDKVEHRYNEPNFLVCKMLPVPFQKCCTMGTAGQWKSLMLAWSYENNLAIPPFGESKSFTGGLSRVIQVGLVENVAKLDYNSLYPSIDLTFGIKDSKDLMNSMLSFLGYVLTQREKYKKLKKEASKKAEKIKNQLNIETNLSEEEKGKLIIEMNKWKREASANDKKQLPLKIFANSFFGSFGAPNVFPWASTACAERTTCTGRMALRLMISHFNKLGYKPIVGDSFTHDTPVFIKYNDGLIDIKPISKLVNLFEIKVDELGREYDYSKKNFKVLCRSGWVEPSYIYRHKTDKDIYKVEENNMTIKVTEDHSLFNDKQEKINPNSITNDTKLEYYKGEIKGDRTTEISEDKAELYGKHIAQHNLLVVPVELLNTDNKEIINIFFDSFIKHYNKDTKEEFTPTCLAGLNYLRSKM